MKKILFSILILMTLLISCTDQEDIDISYKSNFEITASHIFDSYRPLNAGDFDMSKEGWKLHIQMFVYNQQGLLVDSVEQLTGNISETIQYKNTLVPGAYTLLTIADFREGLGGQNFKFWNVMNSQKIEDISIIESDNVFPVAFETLGLDIQNINVTNKTQNISIDIKPVTCLVQIQLGNGDYTEMGNNGFSRFTYLAKDYYIKSVKTLNNIRCHNGVLDFKYGKQSSDSFFEYVNLDENINSKKPTSTYSYRAILPEQDKQFIFQIQKKKLSEDSYKIACDFCGEFDTEGKSNVISELKSGNQYILNMLLDGLKLDIMEYDKNYVQETFNKDLITSIRKESIHNMLNNQYENLLGKDEDVLNDYIKYPVWFHDRGVLSGEDLSLLLFTRSHSSHFERYISAGFDDENYTNCVIIQLILPKIDESLKQVLLQQLTAMYRVDEEMTAGNIYCFLNPNQSEKSKYRIVLDVNKKESMSLSYVLRK